MKIEGLTSPHHKLAGLYHFARLLDKLRLLQAGVLPVEYHRNLGMQMDWMGICAAF